MRAARCERLDIVGLRGLGIGWVGELSPSSGCWFAHRVGIAGSAGGSLKAPGCYELLSSLPPTSFLAHYFRLDARCAMPDARCQMRGQSSETRTFLESDVVAALHHEADILDMSCPPALAATCAGQTAEPHVTNKVCLRIRGKPLHGVHAKVCVGRCPFGFAIPRRLLLRDLELILSFRHGLCRCSHSSHGSNRKLLFSN